MQNSSSSNTTRFLLTVFVLGFSVCVCVCRYGHLRKKPSWLHGALEKMKIDKIIMKTENTSKFNFLKKILKKN
jgi:hypothetical protein